MRILCVVSGGDAPGINAALYHSATLAAQRGDELFGAAGGFPGLLNEAIIRLNPRDLLPWAAMPGSFLESSRQPVLNEPEAQTKISQVLDQHRIDALILFGGDGTLRHIPPLLEQWGIAWIGLPTTIDNDVAGTELTLGFDSACNFAHAAIDGIRATGHALPGRIFTLETLGGNTGFLALEVAHAAGADVVVLPEYDYDPAQIAARLAAAVERQGQALLVYGEGVPGVSTLLNAIPDLTGIRVRDTRLGHAQRGSAVSHRDRWLAMEMMTFALDALHSGTRGGVTVVRGGQVMLHASALDPQARKLPDLAQYQRINGLTTFKPSI